MSLTELLVELPSLQRRAVTLVYVDGCSVADAARTLQVDRAAVGAALAAAFARISRWLHDTDDTGDVRTLFPAVERELTAPSLGVERHRGHGR